MLSGKELPTGKGQGDRPRGRAGMHIAVTRQGKATGLILRRAVASPQPFQPVRLNLCKEIIEVDSKPNLSLGQIPNLTVSAHFLSLSCFLSDSRRRTDQCQLSTYENSLQIQAVTLSLLHSRSRGTCRLGLASLLSRSLHGPARLPHGAVAGSGPP